VHSTVLIVDDDQDIRESLAEALEGSGFMVRCAANGQEALEWLKLHARETSLVLLDLMMPVMDGEAFLRAKENMPGLWGLPVVVMSAGGSSCERLQREHVVRECLPKPIPWSKLLGTLRLQMTATAGP
jgi:CheY-like chemotaxis protein